MPTSSNFSNNDASTFSTTPNSSEPADPRLPDPLDIPNTPPNSQPGPPSYEPPGPTIADLSRQLQQVQKELDIHQAKHQHSQEMRTEIVKELLVVAQTMVTVSKQEESFLRTMKIHEEFLGLLMGSQLRIIDDLQRIQEKLNLEDSSISTYQETPEQSRVEVEDEVEGDVMLVEGEYEETRILTEEKEDRVEDVKDTEDGSKHKMGEGPSMTSGSKDEVVLDLSEELKILIKQAIGPLYNIKQLGNPHATALANVVIDMINILTSRDENRECRESQEDLLIIILMNMLNKVAL